MKVISVINQKGGVAKTTTTRNMAYVLATKFGKRVLLIDMDDSGNLSEAFGCMPPEEAAEETGVSRLLCDKKCQVADVVMPTNYEGIHIIPCNSTLAAAKIKIETDQIAPMQFRLQNKLRKLKGDSAYDFCLIDTKAGLDALVVNALAASDEAIIPTTVDKDSLLMATRAVDAIEQVTDYSEVTLRGFLFTMVNPRTALERQGITVLADSIQYPVFDTFIRQSAAVKQTRWTYQMCDEGSKGCPPALDYDNFVCELLGVERMHKEGASRKKFAEEYNKQLAQKAAAAAEKKRRGEGKK